VRRLLLCLLLAFPLAAAEVRVSAAASLTEAVSEIARSYEHQSPDRVIFNFGGSSALARQIEAGAPADLFLSADEEKMDSIEKAGFVVRGTRVSILSNTLVVVTSGLAIDHPRKLATTAVQRLALAEPSSVPAGIYARQWLEKRGLWKAVAGKVIPTENVRAALAAVEAGNADAAIVYRTDARIAKRVRVAYEVDAGEGPAISYPFALLRDAEEPAAARAFLAYLQGKAARAIFARHGFLLR
jgi:molybdate transport system substrate-binding protein